MSDSLPTLVSDVEPAASWLEQLFIRAIRYLPGIGKTSSVERLQTAIRGSAWTIIGYGASQLLRLTSMVILAHHLLGPAAFGLVALVYVFISGLNLISDLGVGTDVIQHNQGDEPAFINTAWLIQSARGVTLWVIASALAYPFALFYHQPEVFRLSLAAASTVLITGLSSASIFTLTRHIRLGKLTMLRIGAEATGLVVSVSWAAYSPTAWALVVGRIVAELFFTIGTHAISEMPMSLRWDPSAAKHILAFGAGMFASSATYFLAGESERLVVGKFVSLVMLGCFSLALSITAATTSGVQRILSQVFFPMISHSVRRDLRIAERHFRQGRYLLLALSIGMAVTFITGGRWIVAVLLGPKYVMAGWILQLLGFRAAIDLFTSATTHMLFALGTSKYAAAGNLSKLGFLAVGLTVALGKFDFREAVWVLAFAPIFAYIPLLAGIKRHCRDLFGLEIGTFAIFMACSGAAALLREFLN